MILNILFDLDDTLYEILPIFEQSVIACFPDFLYSNIEEIYKTFREQSDILFDYSRESDDNLRKMQILRIQRTLFIYGYIAVYHDAEKFHQKYEYLQYNVKLSSKKRDVLMQLKQEGYILGLLTNGDSNRQRQKIRSLKLEEIFEDKIFVSGDYHFNKPDIRIFEKVASFFPKNQFVFIGDSFSNDIIGASDAGWIPVWLNMKKQIINNSDVRQYYEIFDFEEVLNVIEMIQSRIKL